MEADGFSSDEGQDHPRLSRSRTIERRGNMYVVSSNYTPGRLFDEHAQEVEVMADDIQTQSAKLAAKASRYATLCKTGNILGAIFIVVAGLLVAVLTGDNHKQEWIDWVLRILGGATAAWQTIVFTTKLVERGVEYKKTSGKLRELAAQVSHDKIKIKSPDELYVKLEDAFRKLNNYDLRLYQNGIGDSGKRASHLASKSRSARESIVTSSIPDNEDVESDEDIIANVRAQREKKRNKKTKKVQLDVADGNGNTRKTNRSKSILDFFSTGDKNRRSGKSKDNDVKEAKNEKREDKQNRGRNRKREIESLADFPSDGTDTPEEVDSEEQGAADMYEDSTPRILINNSDDLRLIRGVKSSDSNDDIRLSQMEEGLES